MKNSIYFLLLIFVITSCSRSEDDYNECEPYETTQNTIPDGYTFNLLSKFESTGPFWDFQMLSSAIGYIRSIDEEGDFLLRTEDGCNTWTRISLTDFKNISDIEFMNESTGYISHKSEEGAPLFSKTINAGLDWEQIETPDFENPLYSLIAYTGTSLYGIHKFAADSLGMVDSLHLMRYSEQENTWSILQRSKGQNSLSIVDVRDNRLFFNLYTSFYIAYINGTIEKRIRNVKVDQVQRVDADNMYIIETDYGNCIKRTPSNGGDGVDTSFDLFTMFYGQGVLLDFSFSKGALMFLDLEIDDYYCSSTSTSSSFAIGDGFDLIVSKQMKDKPFDSFKEFQKSDDDTYLMLFDDEIHELKRL